MAHNFQQATTSIGMSLSSARVGAYRRVSSCLIRVIHRSAENKVIPAKGKALVDTQISLAVPVGTYGRVAPRSGLGTFCCIHRMYVQLEYRSHLLSSIQVHD